VALAGSFELEARQAINARVRAAVADRPNIKFVDLDTALKCEALAPCPLFRTDLTHLTPQGYDAIGEVITRRLRD
jgi:lysophospholipase L1-like esterase